MKGNIFVKAGKFLKKNAYYVLLFVCVLAVGTMITMTIASTAPEIDSGVDNPIVEKPDTNTPTPDTNTNPTPDTNTNPTPDTDVVTTPIVFSSPVNGEVLCGYAGNELVYCSTLKQWQTHCGIDYSAEVGDSVKCVYDGVVKSVTYDMLKGNVIEVDHGNGLVTRYGALDTVSVAEGDKVTKDFVLGTVGNTAMGEIDLGTHLHFEALLDGVSVNPLQYSADNK